MVFDIDGVLADCRHRLHHLTTRPKDWDAFFAEAPADPLLAPGARLVDQAAADGHTVLYLTGRPERCRQDTLGWLSDCGLPAGELLMRRDDDRRPARFAKVNALRRLARRWTIVAFVDDDAAVVDSVRQAGFEVLHARWMNPDTIGADGLDTAAHEQQETLFAAQEQEGRT